MSRRKGSLRYDYRANKTLVLDYLTRLLDRVEVVARAVQDLDEDIEDVIINDIMAAIAEAGKGELNTNDLLLSRRDYRVCCLGVTSSYLSTRATTKRGFSSPTMRV